MTTFPAASNAWMCLGLMVWIFALVWTSSVRMPACEPVSETAGTSIAFNAIAVSAMVVCSPVVRSMSISRSLGSGMISLASLMRLSVTPLIAETTTTTSSPCARYFATRLATFLMRSGLPTEVPPYFWTINAMLNQSEADGPRHRVSSGIHDHRLKARGLDRVVRIFQPVAGHRGGHDAAGGNASRPDAFDDARQGGGARRFHKNSVRARDGAIRVQDFIIRHLVNESVGFLDGIGRALPTGRVADADGG